MIICKSKRWQIACLISMVGAIICLTRDISMPALIGFWFFTVIASLCLMIGILQIPSNQRHQNYKG